MPPRVTIPVSRKSAESMLGRKASPDANLSPKDFLKKNPPLKPLTDAIGKAKNKVIDVTSDIMSYPARRNAQKSIIAGDKKYKEVINARTDRDKQKQALQATTKQPQLSQKDTYAKAMNKAQKNGGSSGVGVGK